MTEQDEDEFLTKLSREVVEIMGQKSAIEITQETLGKTAIVTPEELARLIYGICQRQPQGNFIPRALTFEQTPEDNQKFMVAVAGELLNKYAVIPRLPLAESVPLPFDPDDYPVA